jgi:hypothetical protein
MIPLHEMMAFLREHQIGRQGWIYPHTYTTWGDMVFRFVWGFLMLGLEHGVIEKGKEMPAYRT